MEIESIDFDNNDQASEHFQSILKRATSTFLIIPASIKYEYLKIDSDFNPLNNYTQLIMNGTIPSFPFLDDEVIIKNNEETETITIN